MLGPEVAALLPQWTTNHADGIRAEVEQVSKRRKGELMYEVVLGDYWHPMRNGVVQ